MDGDGTGTSAHGGGRPEPTGRPTASSLGSRYAPGVAQLHRFLVLWGQMGKPLFTATIVEAFDAEDALAVASDLHPELHRPRVAVPAAAAGPLARRYAGTEGRPTTEE